MAPTDSHVISRPTDAPTAAEIEGARRSIIPARIDRRSIEVPPAIAAGILGPDGAPLPLEQLFPFRARPSNSLPDFYFTYQTLPTLENYAQNALDGVALMLAHDTYEMPVGYSYNGWVEVDEFGTPEERAAAIEARGGVRTLLPMAVNDPLAWLFVEFYMQRGLSLGKKPNDEVIAGIMSGTVRDMSITFYAKVLRCSICHLDIYDWSWDGGCPHIPGVEYDLGDLGNVVCVAAVEGGEMVEVSLVYKGATPGAHIVEVKSRMVADAGRLTSGEARQLSALEAKLGRRLVDPSQLRKAIGKTITVPALTAGRTASQKKETTNMARTSVAGKPTQVRAPGDPGADPGATTDTTAADLEQVVADQATNDAESLATQIGEVQAQIVAEQAVIDGINAQITGAQNATASDGTVIDNTELIAGLQQQLEGEQAIMDSLNANLAALQQELDGVNATADATGGTPTDAPTDAGAATPTTVSNAIARARASVAQMRAIARRYLPQAHPYMRDATDAQLQPIIADAQALVDALNALLTASGSNAVRSSNDRVIFDAIRRATGVKEPGFAQVRALIQEASAGRVYIKDLQDQCVRERVRAVGAEHFDEQHYRRMLHNLDAQSLQTELRAQQSTARQIFTPGRRVVPVNGTGSIDMSDEEARAAAGSTETSPTPFSNN
jgi:hypothetical protein